MAAPSNPRRTRLQKEWEGLQVLNSESDAVQVVPVRAGSTAPEEYLVTFRCRGIIGINSSQLPIYGDEHRVGVYCLESFPGDPPVCGWLTEIWHPNIRHDGHKGVCINKNEWLGGQTIVDLCRMMFEMVQYRNYHAIATQPPFPLDKEVAQWVRDVAEPRGIVNKTLGKFVDNKPFTRPTVPRPTVAVSAPALGSRIKLMSSGPASPPRIRLRSDS